MLQEQPVVPDLDGGFPVNVSTENWGPVRKPCFHSLPPIQKVSEDGRIVEVPATGNPQ